MLLSSGDLPAWSDSTAFLRLLHGIAANSPYFSQEIVWESSHYSIPTRIGCFLFGSEPKAILAHPIQSRNRCRWPAEIFAVGPARTPGVGVYRNMSELKPGHWMIVDPNGVRTHSYWSLVSQPHLEDEAATAHNVHDLLKDTVERQLVSDVPVCTLLSGGLDSSALSAFATAYYQQQGQGQLTTYSVDYVDNDKYFKSNAFQPNADAPWIQMMSQFLGTDHHDIQFDTPELFEALKLQFSPGIYLEWLMWMARFIYSAVRLNKQQL